MIRGTWGRTARRYRDCRPLPEDGQTAEEFFAMEKSTSTCAACQTPLGTPKPAGTKCSLCRAQDRIATLERELAEARAQADDYKRGMLSDRATVEQLRAQLALAEAVCEAAEEGLKGDMDLLRVRQPVVQALAAWRAGKS